MAAPVLLGNGLDAPIVCPEESPSAPAGAPPAPGIRRLLRGGRACNLHGVLIYFGGDPKGVQGGERKATLLASIRDNSAVSNFPRRGLTRRLLRGGRACNPHGVLIYFGGDPKGCRGRAESPLHCIIGNNFAVSNSPWRGLTRRLRREGRACSPMGRSHFSFGGERKVCKRKPAARRLREKALYCPF